MVAVLVLVALSGCAANSRYQMAGDVGAIVAGAVAGNYVDRKMGGKGPLGGVIGAVVAHQVYAGSQESGSAKNQEWWPCKPGFGQVWKTRSGKDVPACEKGAPELSRPVQQQQVAQSQYRSAGEEAAAHRGLADRQTREQAVAERNAYCTQNPYGCQGYRRSSYHNNYNY